MLTKIIVFKKILFSVLDSAVVVIKPNLTITGQLRADLLKDYDPYITPITVNDVQVIIFAHFNIRSVKYDVAKSLMTTHGNLIMVIKNSSVINNFHDNINKLKNEKEYINFWESNLRPRSCRGDTLPLSL